jgi:hypothetical protein
MITPDVGECLVRYFTRLQIYARFTPDGGTLFSRKKFDDPDFIVGEVLHLGVVEDGIIWVKDDCGVICFDSVIFLDESVRKERYEPITPPFAFVVRVLPRFFNSSHSHPPRLIIPCMNRGRKDSLAKDYPH